MKFREPHFNWIANAPNDLIFPKATAANYLRDPRSLLFKLSRYKVVGKLLAEYKNVLEIGCGDGFASPIVRQEVFKLTICDIDDEFIRLAREFLDEKFDIRVFHSQEIFSRSGHTFDGIYCMDVMEHIGVDEEENFLLQVTKHLHPNGTFIAGIPSIESQAYTTEENKRGHINCKETSDFKRLFEKYFSTVMVLGMNDENLHLGFVHLRSYNIFICTQKIKFDN